MSLSAEKQIHEETKEKKGGARKTLSLNKRSGYERQVRAFCCSLSRCIREQEVKASGKGPPMKCRFIAEVNRLVPLFSKLTHEASLCANWLLRIHAENAVKFPLFLDQNFYRCCLAKVLGCEVGVKQKRNLKRRKDNHDEGKCEEEEKLKMSKAETSARMYGWISKLEWKTAFPELESELKGYSIQLDVIARQMNTNCITMLETTMDQRQMTLLGLTFPKKVADKIRRAIISVKPDVLIRRFGDEFRKAKAKLSREGKEGQQYDPWWHIQQHRSRLFGTTSTLLRSAPHTLMQVFKDPLKVVRYYYWIGLQLEAERDRRTKVRKEGKGATTKKETRLRVYQLSPLHRYKRLSLHIQSKLFYAILTKINAAPSAISLQHLKVEEQRKLWLDWINIMAIRAPPRDFDFAFLIHTNGVQASIFFDKLGGKKASKPPPGRKGKGVKRKKPESSAFDTKLLKDLSTIERGLVNDKQVKCSLRTWENARVISVDPGVCDIVTVKEGKHFRKFSSGEWRHWRRTRVRQKRLEYHLKKFKAKSPEIAKTFELMSSQTFTTFASKSFIKEWGNRRPQERTIWEFYEKRMFSKHAFDSFQNRQRAARAINERILGLPTDIHCNGRNRERSEPLSESERKERSRRKRKVIVAYGNGKYKTCFQGKQGATPLLPIPKALAGIRNEKVCVVLTDEFRSSKLCSQCHKTLQKSKLRSWRKHWDEKRSCKRLILKDSTCNRLLTCQTQTCIRAQVDPRPQVLDLVRGPSRRFTLCLFSQRSKRNLIHRDENATENIEMLCQSRLTTQSVPKSFRRKDDKQALQPTMLSYFSTTKN